MIILILLLAIPANTAPKFSGSRAVTQSEIDRHNSSRSNSRKFTAYKAVFIQGKWRETENQGFSQKTKPQLQEWLDAGYSIRPLFKTIFEAKALEEGQADKAQFWHDEVRK